jgi:hypothetical protein
LKTGRKLVLETSLLIAAATVSGFAYIFLKEGFFKKEKTISTFDISLEMIPLEKSKDLNWSMEYQYVNQTDQSPIALPNAFSA